MSAPPPPSTPVRAASRRAVYTAMFIDAMGSGVWMPFDLIFFTQARGQPVQLTGAAMTAGALVGLVVGLLSGPVVDRAGPRRLLVASNVVRALAFAVYPFVDSLWHVMAIVFLTVSADRVFWTSNVPFIGTLVSGRAVDQFIGNCTVLRVTGMGIGAGVAGFFATSYRVLNVFAWINAVSFLLAALLLVPVVGARPAVAAPAATPDNERSRMPLVLRDRAFLLFCLTQTCFVLINSSFIVILPLVIVDAFHGPTWLPGISIVAGNIILATMQRPVLARAARRSRSQVLLSSVWFYLAAFFLLAGADLVPSAMIAVVLIASIVGAVAEVISAPLMAAAAFEAAPAHAKGRYSAVFQATFGLAQAAAPAIFASLLGLGNSALWLALAAVSVLVVPLIVHLRGRLPPSVLLTAPGREADAGLEAQA